MGIDALYLDELRKRRAETHVHRKYQLIGLELAEILRDEEHKSLYIKLAKEYDFELLLRLAKEIAERKNVQKKGAYFMRLWSLRKPALRHADGTRHPRHKR